MTASSWNAERRTSAFHHSAGVTNVMQVFRTVLASVFNSVVFSGKYSAQTRQGSSLTSGGIVGTPLHVHLWGTQVRGASASRMLRFGNHSTSLSMTEVLCG